MEKKYNFVKLVILCGSLFAVACTDINSEKSNSVITNTLRNTAASKLADFKSVNELFNKQRFKNKEHFVFSNHKGFVYKGRGGTVLVFPPNVFDCDPKDSVKMEICEFADLKSIVNANLSTLSNNKMLESNGMVYCKAYSHGKELKLKKGKSFKCMFNKPTSKGFKLFEGEDVSGNINWKNPVDEIVAKNNSVQKIKISKVENSKKEALTLCTYGTPNDITNLEKSIQFPSDSLTHLISYFFDSYDIAYSDLVPFDSNESIMLNFTLTKAGRLLFINADNPINPKIKSKLLSYFDKIPTMNGYTNLNIGVKEDLPMYISVCPNKSLNERLANDNNNMTKVNQIIAGRELKEKNRQIALEKEQAVEVEKLRKEHETWKKGQELLDRIDESSKIVFASTQMGWINCDRFYNDQRRKVAIEFLDLKQYETYNIQIIFPQIKSILAVSSNTVANNIPINESIKIIFVGMKDSNLFFESKTITTEEVNKITFAAVSKIKESELSGYIENVVR